MKIKLIFGKNTLVEDRGRRTAKYRPLGKCSQFHIKMETAQKVVLLRFRKARKEAPGSGSSSNSWTWINMVHGFNYPLTTLTYSSYPQTSAEGGEEEQPKVPFETHPKNNVNKNVLPPFHPITMIVPMSQSQREKHPHQTKSK